LVEESRQLATFVAESRFDDVPVDVTERMKTYVLDSLAAGLLGCKLPWSKIVFDVERGNATTGPCSIFGSTTSLGPAAAAYVNGTMVGAFEAEHSGHTAHPGGTVVPAALAAAEALDASGEELLLACVMGYEIVCRVGDAQTRLVEDERGFHNPAANGPFSSAAAVGKLLHLDAAKQLDAFGIAGSMAGGLIEFAWDGAMTKRLHIGLANRGGLESAYLASRGFTGPGTVLEGQFGYLHAFSPAPRPDLLVADLGTKWLARDMKLKPYAAHGTVQAVIAALIEFKQKQPIKPDDVAQVHVRASTARMLQPRFLQRCPKTLLQAQLSLPFVVATALHRDLADPLQFDESTLTDERIARLAAAVTWTEVETEDPAFAHLEITVGRQTYEIFAGDYRGTASMPAAWDDVTDKFHRYSQHVLDAEQRQRVIEAVRTLGSTSNVADLLSLVRG
jgi:2-methylcitrate dehydratase PrpD